MRGRLLAAVLALTASPLCGHEMRPAYLEIREATPGVFDVVWKVPARGDNQRLSLRLRFSEDVEILGEPVSGFAAGSHLQRLRIRHEGGLTGAVITIDGLSGTFTDVLLRLERLDGAELTRRLSPDEPSYEVEASPSWTQVAWVYFVLGVEHILLGIDHLLFVLSLLLIVVGRRKLIGTITAFTAAHSITLALATLGLVHVPGPPVEAVIALSIVFVAAEIVRRQKGESGLTARAPWLVAFTFGLLHGFGFAGALSEVGLPQKAIPLALLTFNLGVEVGQLLFVAAALAVFAAWRRVSSTTPEWAGPIPAYAIGGVAAFWVIERVAGF